MTVKLFVVTSDIQPSIFVKAETPEEALEKFTRPHGEGGISGFRTQEIADEYLKHPSFQVLEVTWNLLMALTPDEFSISEETGF